MPKVLVAFFSLTGSTRLIGKTIAKELGADVLEITPAQQYPLRGLGKYLHGGGQAVMGATPLLEPASVNISDYDLYVVGTPVWAGRIAPPVRTFLMGLALGGKKVAYFSTFLGTEGQSLKEMAEISKTTPIGTKGFQMSRKATHSSVSAAIRWAEELR